MRNRVLGLFLAVTLIATLTACGKSDSKSNKDESANVNQTVAEEETVIGPGGTILHVRRVKDTDGNEILVEQVQNGDGSTVYKQVIVKDDGTVEFADVEKNDKGEYIVKKPDKTENATNVDGENYVDAGDIFNDETTKSKSNKDKNTETKEEKTTSKDKNKEKTTKEKGENKGSSVNDEDGWSDFY